MNAHIGFRCLLERKREEKIKHGIRRKDDIE